jgi:hypothetical protein
VKFAEYQWARSHNQTYAGFGAGGVLFLVFFILFGLTASGLSRVNWGFVDTNDDWGDWGWFGTRYEFTANFDQPMMSGNQVKIRSPHGAITITPSPDDQAHVFMHKYTRSHSQDEANQFNNATQPRFQQQGNIWLLDMTGNPYDQGRFDLEVQVPPKYSVSVVDRHGDVHVSQMQADVDVEASHGDVTAEQIKGNTTLHLEHGDVTAKGISGNVTVEGYVGDSNVSDVTGMLSFSGSFTGDVDLSHIGNQVRFKSSRTDLQFAKLDGEMRMDRGDFHANALAGPLILRTEAKDIHVEDITGDVEVEDHRGDVAVQAKAPLGNVQISTTGGEISIGLPETPGFQVDAESNGGQIESDYKLNINNQGRNATATGSVGNGKSQVKLRTDRGTIQIKKD